MAIADFHSCNVADNAASSPEFKHLLYCARLAGADFTPPNRNKINRPLLKLNYNRVMEANLKAAQEESILFGQTYLGDGATIHKIPLINVLLMTANQAPIVTLIND